MGLAHQTKFLLHANRLSSIPRKYLFFVNTYPFGSVRLSDEFAYLHIWKSGGTTIEKQSHYFQDSAKAAKDLSLVTFIRDPLDHFLSGGAECGYRWHSEKRRNNSLAENRIFTLKNRPYYKRIQDYLEYVQHHIQLDKKSKYSMCLKTGKLITPNCWDCARHSYPQFNFLLTQHGTLRKNIKVIGDIREMEPILKELVYFPFDSNATFRNSSEQLLKKKRFAKQPYKIRENTMLQICEFL